MRPDKDEWALRLAEVVAQRGTCLRRQVGAVLLDKDGRVLATGYNGRPAGSVHCNQKEAGTTYGAMPTFCFPHACPAASAPSGTQLEGCEAIHAEANALLQCRDTREIWTCAVTTSPCIHCVKLLLNTGCRRIIFRERYSQDGAAMKLWHASCLRFAPVPYDLGPTWDHQPETDRAQSL